MAESPARLNVTSHKDIAVVEFTENKILDEMSVSEIERALTTLLESKERPKILLDFANVDHLSSAALGMLINVNNRIKQQNGQLRLANIKPQNMEVFFITKLNPLFSVSATPPQAPARFEETLLPQTLNTPGAEGREKN